MPADLDLAAHNQTGNSIAAAVLVSKAVTSQLTVLKAEHAEIDRLTVKDKLQQLRVTLK